MTGEDLYWKLRRHYIREGYHAPEECRSRFETSQHNPKGCDKCTRLLRDWVSLSDDAKELFHQLATWSIV